MEDSVSQSSNYIASNLKKFYDDTTELLPKSRHSDISYKRSRWRSRTDTDYPAHLNWRETYFRMPRPITTLPFDGKGSFLKLPVIKESTIATSDWMDAERIEDIRDQEGVSVSISIVT